MMKLMKWKGKFLTEGNWGRHYSIFRMRKKFDFETKIFNAQSSRIKRDVTEKMRREKEEFCTDILKVKSVKLSWKTNHPLILSFKNKKS